MLICLSLLFSIPPCAVPPVFVARSRTRNWADLKSLEAEGHEVIRHNLAHEPASFARNVLVKSLVGEFRKEALPIVLVDGELGSRGVYPSREELLCMANGRLDAPLIPEAKQGCCQGQCC